MKQYFCVALVVQYIQRLQDVYSNFRRKQKSGKNTRARVDTRGRAENQRVWRARMYFARSSVSYLKEITCSVIPTLCIMEFSWQNATPFSNISM